MYLYIIIFILLSILAIEYELKIFNNTEILVFIAFFLSLFAGLRGVDVSRDYPSYIKVFYIITHWNDQGGTGILPAFEPGFVLIVKTCYYFFKSNYSFAIMLFFAFTSIFLKLFVIKKLSINPFLVLLLYFSYFFLCQEMTQIRNGMACSLFFIAVYYYLKNEKWKSLFLILIACTFHESSVLYLFLFCFNLKNFNKYFYIPLFVSAILLGILKLPLLPILANFNLGDISDKLETYYELASKGYTVDVHFLNVMNLCNIGATAIIIYYVVKNKITDSKLLLFLKMNIFSLFIFGFLVDISSVAFRFNELFWVFFVFLFPYLTQLLPFKKFNIFFVIAIACIFFYICIFYEKLVGPYTIVNF